MDPLVQIITTVVSMAASFVLAFGGLAGWFLRRLDRRFDALERQARDDKTDMQRQFDAQRTGMQRQFDGVQRQFDALREDHGRLSDRIDAVGERVEVVSDELSNARQSLGRLEGFMLRNADPETLATPRQR